MRALVSSVAVLVTLVALFATLSFGASREADPKPRPGQADGLHGVQPSDCEGLASRWITEIPEAPARLVSSERKPAETVTIGQGGAGIAVATEMRGREATLPAHCVVRGYIAPQISIELRLPDAASWNSKFQLVACAGFCGQVPSSACSPGLSRGYAVATSDGGHHTDMPGFDGVWAWNNRQAEIDFGHRANHVLALVAKAITEAYYGRPIEYSYAVGCSKGGNSAVMEAIHYPDDFDGVIASAPVLDYQGRVATSFSWQAQAVTDERGRPVFSAEDFALVHEAVLDQCDGLDGLEDRVINDPQSCRVDTAALRCGASAAGGCLTKQQVDALRELYAAPTNSRGRVVYPAGLTPGSELGWAPWLTEIPGSPVTPLTEVGADQYLAYMAFPEDPGPAFGWRDFDFDRTVKKLRAMSPVYDATSTDLRRFRAAGGKLLIPHGTHDPGIQVEATIDYYHRLVERTGGRRATQEFARLFMVPGMYHCSGGPGVDRFDALGALEDWVEHGRAPERLIAAHADDGGEIDRRMPVYPYPLTTRYDGSGDPADPSSYVPVTSASWRNRR